MARTVQRVEVEVGAAEATIHQEEEEEVVLVYKYNILRKSPQRLQEQLRQSMV